MEVNRLYLAWKVTAKPYRPISCYECEICRNINATTQLHCRTCGTIPQMYSILRTATREVREENYSNAISYFIPSLVAWGAIRQTSTRTCKRLMRTVKTDYYAYTVDEMNKRKS